MHKQSRQVGITQSTPMNVEKVERVALNALFDDAI
jgi:hypothetical protein